MIAARALRRLEGWLAERGARLERSRYRRDGGETEAFRWIPPAAPRGRVLVAHGAGNDALFPLVALGRTLVAAGWELFFFDLDGHGTESTTRFSAAGADAALAAAAEQAVVGRPPLPLHVVGQSLGGSLALHALSTPALAGAASAVLISAPLQVRVTARVAAAELAGFFHPSTLSQRAHYGLWGLVPAVGPLRRGAFPFRLAPGESAPGALGYVPAVNALLARLALEEAAARVATPTLLLYGGRDHLVPPEQGRRIAAALPAARFVEVPGATHWSLSFAPPVLQAVAGWLEVHG